MRGVVYGTAGGGLTGDVSWAANADVAAIGRQGELKTAALLDPYAAAEGGPSVLHDLRIPIPGFSANIDHVVVVGRTVHLIDSKVWAPGFYFTFGGKTRRHTRGKGLARFEPADKKTMVMAREAVERHLRSRGVTAQVVVPTLLVWPSNNRAPLRKALLRVPGARVLTPAQFTSYAKKSFKAPRIGTRTADAQVVAALTPLLVQVRPAGSSAA